MRFLAAMSNTMPPFRPLLAALLAAGLCQVANAIAAEPPRVAEEYDLKAAFLFNLAKFVQWPPVKFAQEDSPLVIGVRGDEAFDRFGRLLGNKVIGKHKLVVRRLESTEDLRSCHILFLSRSEKEPLEGWAEAGKGAGALTVGETEKFLEQGGMIQFSLEAQELRLQINAQCVQRGGLTITANALSALVNKGIAKVRNF
jgi:hypothetical protein